jgi:hypothetical protein
MPQGLPQVKTASVSMRGGIDLSTPHDSIQPGFMLEARNFKALVTGGYQTINGYERTCGGPTLDSNPWYALTLSNTTSFTIGTALTDATSGATGYIVAKDDTLKQLCIVNLTGSFGIGNSITAHSGVTVVAKESQNGAGTSALNRAWQLASNNYFRNLLSPVPGTGNVLGVWVYKTNYYAFRSNGTNVIMYVGNGTSWTAVTFYSLLKFNTGVGAVGDLAEGVVITGGTSGATGTIKRIVKYSGSWGTDAAGYMVVQISSGAFINAEAIKKAGVTKATTNGASSAITLTAGANKFQFVNYNFYASTDTFRMYGCDGVNPAFEFDGTIFTPIILPTLPNAPFDNKPLYIEAHKNYLWLAFRKGSLQSSVLGEPLNFSGFLGAAEYGLGSEIKGMRSVLDNALIISTERQISAMYGSTTADFTLKVLSADTSGIDNTCAVSVRPYMMTKKGIIRLDPTQAFGDFQSGTVSRLIWPLVNDLISTKAVVGAGISRINNQYRIYLNDGTGIILTQDALYADNSLPQFTTFSYYHIPVCISSVNVDDYTEVMLFGDKDGYVYREDTGNNCDGQPMVYALRTPFLHLGSPSIIKRYKRIEINSKGTNGSAIRFSYELAYGNTNRESSTPVNLEVKGAGGYWGAGRWAQMSWSSPIIDQQILSLTGNGQNISFLFYGNSDQSEPFTLNSVTVHYLPNRINRG